MTGTIPILPDDNALIERLLRYFPHDTDVDMLSDEQIVRLNAIYRSCRNDADEYFRRKMNEVLEPTYDELLVEAIEKHLPSGGPSWQHLSEAQQERLQDIYITCFKKDLTVMALRKHIRVFILDGIDDFEITETEAPMPRLFKAKETKLSKELEKLRVWVQEKLDEKSCITRTDDFEEFHQRFGYAKRTFSKKMRMLGLIFDGKKWVMP